MKGKVKPNYSLQSFSCGCTKSDDKRAAKVYGTNCSWQWPRRFDDKRRKRRVGVVIDRFYGDYHHYYAVLEEERNPYWLPPGIKIRKVAISGDCMVVVTDAKKEKAKAKE